jgi:hypothetical protein
MIAVADAMMLVGGVSLAGNMFPRNGTVTTVSALNPIVSRKQAKAGTAKILRIS